MRFALKILILLLVLISFSGCDSLKFYSQATLGQMQILSSREDITRLLAVQQTPKLLRLKLEKILEIRAFASEKLKLPVGNNFSEYVPIDGQHVLWNVYASPRYSLSSLSWCFPFAGCVTYRGYFNERDARQYAKGLEKRGFDTYVGGVRAYSTLGWFDDVVLSTALQQSEEELAALIFHELAHQVVYIPGDTQFNEGFATTVEQEGLQLWLAEKNSASSSVILSRAKETAERRTDFVSLILETREILRDVYESGMEKEKMEERKRTIQKELRIQYQSMREGWGGYSGYDNWFSGGLNNAQISTVASYNNFVPGFKSIFIQENGEFLNFYERIDELSKNSKAARDAFLNVPMLD
jgi:predicted aminopeptidase